MMPTIPCKSLILCLALTAAQGAAYAIDAVSLELAEGEKVQMLRLGLQSDWAQRWFQSNGSHMGGFWDLSLAQWRGTRYQNRPDQTQDITSIGLTPVLRFQQDDKKRWYAETGVGLHLLSDLYDNDRHRLSTRLQFGVGVGLGFVFNNRIDLGLRLQHFSNAGLKEPNDGIDFVALRARYSF